jgi:hypothetical protein
VPRRPAAPPHLADVDRLPEPAAPAHYESFSLPNDSGITVTGWPVSRVVVDQAGRARHILPGPSVEPEPGATPAFCASLACGSRDRGICAWHRSRRTGGRRELRILGLGLGLVRVAPREWAAGAVEAYRAPASAGRLLYAGLGLAVVWPTSMR